MMPHHSRQYSEYYFPQEEEKSHPTAARYEGYRRYSYDESEGHPPGVARHDRRQYFPQLEDDGHPSAQDIVQYSRHSYIRHEEGESNASPHSIVQYDRHHHYQPPQESQIHPNPPVVQYEFLPPPPQPKQRDNNNQDRAISPTRIDAGLYVTDTDVLCGRGAPNVHHPGNQHFRSLVRARQQEYANLRRQDKSIVVRSILSAIETCGGRFLRQMSSGEWVEVHEAIAYEKVCQALREFQKTRNKARRAGR